LNRMSPGILNDTFEHGVRRPSKQSQMEFGWVSAADPRYALISRTFDCAFDPA
jgi:hypothetical protein